MFLRGPLRLERISARCSRVSAHCCRVPDYRSLRFDHLEERRLLAANIADLPSLAETPSTSAVSTALPLPVAIGQQFVGQQFVGQQFVGPQLAGPQLVGPEFNPLNGGGYSHLEANLHLPKLYGPSESGVLAEGESGLPSASGDLPSEVSAITSSGPSWIEFNGEAVAPEFSPGFVIGALSISSNESTSNFNWKVNDARFEVVDAELRIKESSELDFSSQPTIPLSITAKHQQTDKVLYYPMLLNVLPSEHPLLQMEIESQYTVDEMNYGAVLGSVELFGPYAEGEVLLRVNDPRFEIVDQQLKLKESTRLLRAQVEFLDVIVTARSLTYGTTISKGTRIHVEGDPTPFHNDLSPGDVDGDGSLSPLDTLLIINYLNTHGPGFYEPDGESDGLNLDVNGDGTISPLDALIVINLLNQRSGSGSMTPVVPIDQSNPIDSSFPADGNEAVGEGSQSSDVPLSGEGEGAANRLPGYDILQALSDELDDSEILQWYEQLNDYGNQLEDPDSFALWQQWMPAIEDLILSKRAGI